MSLRASTPLPSACSGEKYAAVPMTAPVCVRLSSVFTARAMPKSVTFTSPVRGDEDVARLDVAVDHAVAVGEGERGGHAGADGGDLARRQRLGVAQDGGEGPAVDELHHDEVGAVVLAPVEDGDDVGMRQVGGGLGLAPEALDEGAVDRQLGEEHLERDGPIELAIHGAVDLGHAAAGDQVGHLIAARIDARVFDRLHGAQSLRWATSAKVAARALRVDHGTVTAVVVVVRGRAARQGPREGSS